LHRARAGGFEAVARGIADEGHPLDPRGPPHLLAIASTEAPGTSSACQSIGTSLVACAVISAALDRMRRRAQQAARP